MDHNFPFSKSYPMCSVVKFVSVGIVSVVIRRKSGFIKQKLFCHGNSKKVLTLFFPMFPFDIPENIRKCFQGYQKGTLGRKGLSYSYFE